MHDLSLTQISHAHHESYTFTPGHTFNFKAKFSEIPHRYHLQVLDKNKNTRFNQYGKGSENGVDLNWPIPKNVNKRNLGIWEIMVKSDTENFSIYFNVKDSKEFFLIE